MGNGWETNTIMKTKQAVIKGSEVRIGNYVNNYKNQIKKIIGVGGEDVVYTNSAGMEYTYPIPLTEDWLLNVGFKSCGSNMFSIGLTNGNTLEIDFVTVNDDSWWVVQITNYESEEGVILNGIDYLHQLQNLFFALTGEESKLGS